jgi:hypothetical protein
MTDPDAAKRAREWLERQLAELGQLRNATRRDQNFKTWRQQTLTVIQRIWPGETRRVERFRRIPFSPPTPHVTDRQAREHFERGWGEAGVLLREFLAEVNLLGLPQIQAAGTYAGSETEAAMGPMPALGGQDAPWPGVETAEVETAAERSARDEADVDDIGLAMDRLLGCSPLSRSATHAPQPAMADEAPAPGSPAAELMRIAGELEALGLSAERASTVRPTLLALARAAQADAPAWELVSEALGHAGATPAFAGRVLPLLLEFIPKAA